MPLPVFQTPLLLLLPARLGHDNADGRSGKRFSDAGYELPKPIIEVSETDVLAGSLRSAFTYGSVLS